MAPQTSMAALGGRSCPAARTGRLVKKVGPASVTCVSPVRPGGLVPAANALPSVSLPSRKHVRGPASLQPAPWARSLPLGSAQPTGALAVSPNAPRYALSLFCPL